MTEFWSESVPANVILAYRAIPEPVRARWKLGGTSTSALAYRAVRRGAGWSAFRRPGGVTAVNMYFAVLAVLGVRAGPQAVDWWTGGPFRLENKELPDWFPTT